MIFLIGGESHTGKTLLAQKLLEKFSYPYLSLDHLKMGLIKGMKDFPFKVDEDEKIAEFLFPIVDGIIQTCIENKQNLIIEGIYL
ncbi:TPA: adenylate kinase, partial [Campylobacter lari]|nr:adenylate kinase [Campylobacter lari]